MLILAAALILAASEPSAAAPEKTPVASQDRRSAMAKLPATDADIQRALFQMLERDPERVVCSIRTHTGSRQPRTSCATLANWFAHRLPAEIQRDEAPWQLVEEIKEQRKKALLKSRKGG